MNYAKARSRIITFLWLNLILRRSYQSKCLIRVFYKKRVLGICFGKLNFILHQQATDFVAEVITVSVSTAFRSTLDFIGFCKVYFCIQTVFDEKYFKKTGSHADFPFFFKKSYWFLITLHSFSREFCRFEKSKVSFWWCWRNWKIKSPINFISQGDLLIKCY